MSLRYILHCYIIHNRNTKCASYVSRYGYTTTPDRVSRSRRAGLHFPVGRIHRFLRKGPYADRVGSFAPVYMATVLEYLCAEIIELAGTCFRRHNIIAAGLHFMFMFRDSCQRDGEV